MVSMVLYSFFCVLVELYVFFGGGNKLSMVSLDVVGSPESAKEVWYKKKRDTLLGVS